MSKYGTLVNTEYGNTGNLANPVFKDIIDNLEAGGIYTSALGIRTTSADNPALPYVATFKNVDGNDNKAVALDVISDAISRAIIKGYRDGFTQASLPKDGASSISFSLIDPADVTLAQGTPLVMAKDVNKALVALAAEVTALKTALATLVGNPQFGMTPIAAINPINANKLSLE